MVLSAPKSSVIGRRSMRTSSEKPLKFFREMDLINDAI